MLKLNLPYGNIHLLSYSTTITIRFITNLIKKLFKIKGRILLRVFHSSFAVSYGAFF